ncbi:RNA polymerase sigma factor [Pseudopedobacter beijingensis]|uniref:RNA polymerase sigma factor n=1 Tax=Pseudopedobacter beijingensis TaxID=1207056 RepID=A0ABW4IAX4_9SPHI
MSEFSDQQVIALLKDSEEKGLTILFKKYWSFLYSVAFNVFRDKDVCEDIVQEIFLKIWEKREELEIRTSLKTYLLSSVKYEVYRQLKKEQAKSPITTEVSESLFAASVEKNLEHKELVHNIASAVNSLPPKCKEIYQLSRNEYLSHKEIAHKMNISTKTVENHLTKALKHLKVSIGSFLF